MEYETAEARIRTSLRDEQRAKAEAQTWRARLERLTLQHRDSLLNQAYALRCRLRNAETLLTHHEFRARSLHDKNMKMKELINSVKKEALSLRVESEKKREAAQQIFEKKFSTVEKQLTRLKQKVCEAKLPDIPEGCVSPSRSQRISHSGPALPVQSPKYGDNTILKTLSANDKLRRPCYENLHPPNCTPVQRRYCSHCSLASDSSATCHVKTMSTSICYKPSAYSTSPEQTMLRHRHDGHASPSHETARSSALNQSPGAANIRITSTPIEVNTQSCDSNYSRVGSSQSKKYPAQITQRETPRQSIHPHSCHNAGNALDYQSEKSPDMICSNQRSPNSTKSPRHLSPLKSATSGISVESQASSSNKSTQLKSNETNSRLSFNKRSSRGVITPTYDHKINRTDVLVTKSPIKFDEKPRSIIGSQKTNNNSNRCSISPDSNCFCDANLVARDLNMMGDSHMTSSYSTANSSISLGLPHIRSPSSFASANSIKLVNEFEDVTELSNDIIEKYL